MVADVRLSDYRQNPSKVYNGVRHQTSMCKAFVKLPRPFGDQSGGARKWAIRAGCETWFTGGGYHPPGGSASPPPPPVVSHSSHKSKSSQGKAKSTAKSKQLVVGTNGSHGTPERKPHKSQTSLDGPWSAGPSSGPAYDGTSRPLMPYQQPQAYQYPAPGYHYLPVPAGHPHQGHTVHAAHALHGTHNGQPVYVPVWGPYGTAPPPMPMVNGSGQMGGQFSSPEHWREDPRAMIPSDTESYEEKVGFHANDGSPRSTHSE